LNIVLYVSINVNKRGTWSRFLTVEAHSNDDEIAGEWRLTTYFISLSSLLIDFELVQTLMRVDKEFVHVRLTSGEYQ
jgi:hypothetical protein